MVLSPIMSMLYVVADVVAGESKNCWVTVLNVWFRSAEFSQPVIADPLCLVP